MDEQLPLTRRDFLQRGAAAGLAATVAMSAAADDGHPARKTRSFHPEMEYRQLGKTGLWVSAVCLGGHWKRVDTMIGANQATEGAAPSAGQTPDAFHKNRRDILSHCIERGINLVDACTGPEILAYSRALKGRREAMFLDYSWSVRELREEQYRSTKALLAGLDQGMKEAGLDYVDLWRVTCFERGGNHTQAEIDGLIGALDAARKQGKARFTGISSHDRPWLKKMIETYPDQIQVVLTPYTADSKALPEDSIFDAIVKHGVGCLGIKPFASNSLFKGDSSPGSPDAAEDDRRARLALRYILGNPAITAPIPGLISAHQIDNAVRAVKERRELDHSEHAELAHATHEMWARLPDDYQWLKDWRHV
jgi:aryl-alcohol dehydrogenase-like predicted oxidoreductase